MKLDANTIVSIIACIIGLVAQWIIYTKMGLHGWEVIIPFYNLYVLFKALYGNGWKFLLFLIPFYNIYLAFKVNIDWAHSFGKSTGFGVGMTLLSTIFLCILAFGDAKYQGTGAAQA